MLLSVLILKEIHPGIINNIKKEKYFVLFYFLFFNTIFFFIQFLGNTAPAMLQFAQEYFLLVFFFYFFLSLVHFLSRSC